jgi:hypothetical protein
MENYRKEHIKKKLSPDRFKMQPEEITHHKKKNILQKFLEKIKNI